MEQRDKCPDHDILCIANSLAVRYELRNARVISNRAARGERDCVPCLLADFEVDGED